MTLTQKMRAHALSISTREYPLGPATLLNHSGRLQRTQRQPKSKTCLKTQGLEISTVPPWLQPLSRSRSPRQKAAGKLPAKSQAQLSRRLAWSRAMRWYQRWRCQSQKMTAQGLLHHRRLAQVMLVHGNIFFGIQRVVAIVALHVGELLWVCGVGVRGCEQTLMGLHGWRCFYSVQAPCFTNRRRMQTVLPITNMLLRMGWPFCVKRGEDRAGDPQK